MNIVNNGLPVDVYGSVDHIIQGAHPGPPKAVVITPSTGSPFLARAIAGVLQQDIDNLVHLIIVDGAAFEPAVRRITSMVDSSRCIICTLPYNTGAGGMNGHRIYAAFPLLLNAEYMFFLDEDNWWDSDHASSLIGVMENNQVDWAFSMRKICTVEEEYVAHDNCESIGPYTPYSNLTKGWPAYIDTNCYAFKRATIVQTAHYWYHPLRADRYFFQQLVKKFSRFLSSQKYTVNYRLKQNGPVSPDYFLKGNQYMLNKYGSRLPWV